MPVNQQIKLLNRKPLSAFKPLYGTLIPPDADSLHGTYRGVFIGPPWLRSIAPIGLSLLSFGGWWGKILKNGKTGLNIYKRSGELQKSNPVNLSTQSSLVDGKPSVIVKYSKENPFPWPYVIDELRSLDDKCILGLTITNVGLLNRIALPFLLYPVESTDEI
jgi:hypothetical protein